MTLAPAIAERIRARRLELGKSGEALALALGKSHSYWNHIERAKAGVHPDLAKVAEVLECRVIDLTAGAVVRGVCCECECTETTPCVIKRGRGSWLACSWEDEQQLRCTFCIHPATRERRIVAALDEDISDEEYEMIENG